MLDSNYDAVAICETWLRPEDSSVIGDITPDGYVFQHVPRLNKKGGGVALLSKSGLPVTVSHRRKFLSFESIELELSSPSNSISISLIIVYRPPRSGCNFTQFLSEFNELIDFYIF